MDQTTRQGQGSNQYQTRIGPSDASQTRQSRAAVAAAVEDLTSKPRRRLKVFRVTAIKKADTPVEGHGRQIRMVVAATSQKAAAEACGMTLSEFRHTGSETGNDTELAVALGAPGQVFWSQLDRKEFQVWEGQEEEARRREEDRQRRVEFEAAVAERRAVRHQQHERAAESNQAACLWASRLRDEFGLDCDPAGNGQVAVTVPAEYLYQKLVDLDGLLRDVDVDETVADLFHVQRKDQDGTHS